MKKSCSCLWCALDESFSCWRMIVIFFFFQGKILVGTKDSEIIEITEKTASSQVRNYIYFCCQFFCFVFWPCLDKFRQIFISLGKFALVSKADDFKSSVWPRPDDDRWEFQKIVTQLSSLDSFRPSFIFVNPLKLILVPDHCPCPWWGRDLGSSLSSGERSVCNSQRWPDCQIVGRR